MTKKKVEKEEKPSKVDPAASVTANEHVDSENAEKEANSENPATLETDACPSCQELEEKIQLLEAKNEELKQLAEQKNDSYVRLNAEFDNYRRRTLREKQDLVSTAAASTIKELLPVLDDFDRAIANSEMSDDKQALLEGLLLVKRNIDKFLQGCGVSEIEALGLPLDTDIHDAITTLAVQEEDRKGKIVEVIKKGYRLNGVVVRHAQVIVGE